MHWFIDPIKNQYVDFSGRTSRKDFWMFTLFFVSVVFLLSFLQITAVLFFLSLLIFVLLLPAFLAIFVRRMHDIGFSGRWIILILFPPAVTLLVLLVGFALYAIGVNVEFMHLLSLLVGSGLSVVTPLLWVVAVTLASLRSEVGRNKYGVVTGGVPGVTPDTAASNEQGVTPSSPGAGTPDVEAKEASQETSPEEAEEPENTKQGFGS